MGAPNDPSRIEAGVMEMGGVITCGKCHLFAKLLKVFVNGWTDETTIVVRCKVHGENEGDYDDWEELGVIE